MKPFLTINAVVILILIMFTGASIAAEGPVACWIIPQ
jgi:hypothetical protein